jgi:hypothetical protein
MFGILHCKIMDRHPASAEKKRATCSVYCTIKLKDTKCQKMARRATIAATFHFVDIVGMRWINSLGQPHPMDGFQLFDPSQPGSWKTKCRGKM